MNSKVYAGGGATLPGLSSDEEDSESCESIGGPEKVQLAQLEWSLRRKSPCNSWSRRGTVINEVVFRDDEGLRKHNYAMKNIYCS